MKTFKTIILTSAAAITFTAPPAHAEDGQSFLSLGVGYYDILDDDEAVDLRVEYRSDHTYFGHVKPWAGLEITTDASLWAGGGFLVDYEFQPQWYVVPSIGAGLYAKGSSDKDLDYPLEFRSQLEVAYELETGSRAGLAFGHLSNASLGDDNPGTEVLNLYWHIPY